MVDAVCVYAARSGLSVAVTVLDRNGVVLASSGDAEEATRKAYTALMYGVATHELKPTSRPLWRSAADIDSARIQFDPGGFPVIEGVDTLGAVGVAGPPPDQSILCCQAAVESRFAPH